MTSLSDRVEAATGPDRYRNPVVRRGWLAKVLGR